jgi:hypothetical protein
MIGELSRALRTEGGMLAGLVRDAPAGAGDDPASPARLAASGPRAAGHEAEYELLLEMIFEGSLLHYGNARVVHTDDKDLALLLGDQLYALGLLRLAALGDVDAVSVLAEVIARLSEAHAEGKPERAQAIWEEGARAIGWGRGALTS